ncbi:MAG: hypothetical protein HOP11_02970 [Saprospiraceae bacterium]|nr:hypothetical protein [Saprospiraceae bacterium]
MIFLISSMPGKLFSQLEYPTHCNDTYRFVPDIPESGSDPCDASNSFQYFPYTSSSQIPTNSLSNTNYYIQQDFIVDANFAFISCKLKFDPGVKIIINQSIRLSLNNSHLFSCTGFWKGIEVNSYSFINSFNNTLIEDAEKAVFNSIPIILPKLSFQYTTFNKNMYGIHLSSFSPGAPLLVNLLFFRGNKFTCTGHIKGTNDITTAGVYLNKVNFSMRRWLYTGANRSKFIGIKHGIQMEGEPSIIDLTSLDFNNIRVAGILGEAVYLQQGQDLKFLNCKTGISILNTYNFLLNNNSSFTWDQLNQNPGTQTGLYFCNLFSVAQLEVANSTFTLSPNYNSGQVYGIHFEKNYGTIHPYPSCTFGAKSKVIINNNSFINTSPKGIFCINMQTPNITSEIESITFYQNYFNIQGANSSVIFSDGNRNNFYFTYNTIEATQGANFENANLMTFRSSIGLKNEITWNNVRPHIEGNFLYYNWADASFTFEMFQNSLICRNISADNVREFVFNGNCQKTQFTRNLARGGKLLEFNLFPIIDEQVLSGNRRFIGIINWTPHVDMSSIPSYSQFSLFNVNEPRTNPPDYYDYHPQFIVPLVIPNSNPPLDWWEYLPGESPIECPVTRTTLTTLDLAIIEDDSAKLNILLPEELYLIKLGLFNYLLAHSDYRNLDPRFDTWIDDITNSTHIDEFVDIQNSILDGYNSTSLNNSLSSNMSIINNLSNLEYNDYDSVGFSSSQLSDQQTLNSNFNDIINTQVTYSDQIKANYINLLSTLNSSTPTNNVEVVIKNFYKAYLEGIINNEMSNSNITALLDIAIKCPRKYGVFPYWANLLVPDCQRVDINYECDPPVQLKKLNNKVFVKDGIYNILGQKVNTDKLNSEKLNLQPGVYIKVKNGQAKKFFASPVTGNINN